MSKMEIEESQHKNVNVVSFTMTPRKLSREDFCDRCPARASTLVLTRRGELLFCSHHAAKNATAILQKGYTVSCEKDYEDE